MVLLDGRRRGDSRVQCRGGPPAGHGGLSAGPRNGRHAEAGLSEPRGTRTTGIAFGDCDGDAWPALFVSGPYPHNRLYRKAREVHDGEGFGSTNSPAVAFALGTARIVERLTVRWPSGTTQAFRDIAPDRRLLPAEGGDLREWRRRARPVASSGAGAPASPR